MRLSLDDYFMNMLKLVAARSTCPRRAVGAIITDLQGHVLSMGYNGVPSGIAHCNELTPCPGAHDQPGNSSRCLSVHAEQNALLQCTQLSRAAVIYVSCLPCFACAKMLLNTPIHRVVYGEPYADDAALNLFARVRITAELHAPTSK